METKEGLCKSIAHFTLGEEIIKVENTVELSTPSAQILVSILQEKEPRLLRGMAESRTRQEIYTKPGGSCSVRKEVLTKQNHRHDGSMSK